VGWGNPSPQAKLLANSSGKSRTSFDPILYLISWKWENSVLNAVNTSRIRYVFPESDLLRALVDSYFAEVNTIYPLLHRPIFDRSLRDELHLRDDGFARVLLAVCAVASRFVDDPRVLLDGSPSLSAGWKYFSQVQTQTPLLAPPSLYDIQLCCVSASAVPMSQVLIVCSFQLPFCTDLRLLRYAGQS
jgi:hypothetical protein